MLISLKINNIALINNGSLQFKKGFNILSGETGAGKSIIIDSLNFVLGSRADKTLLKSGEDFAKVEGVFEVDVENENIINFFKLINLEPEDTVIINRYLSLSGKNDIKVNGETVTLNMLKKLTNHLVDIHGQHEHQLLLDPKNHLQQLDSFNPGQVNSLQILLAESIAEINKINNLISQLGGLGADRKRNIEIITSEISEIELAELKEGEEDELKLERIRLNNFEKMYNHITELTKVLNEDEVSALTLVKAGVVNLSGLYSLDDSFEDLLKRLKSCAYELEDISEAANKFLNHVNYSEERVNKIEERLDVYSALKRKHGNSYQSIMEKLGLLQEQLELLTGSQDQIEKLKLRKKEELNKVYSLCVKLTEVRKIIAAEAERKIEDHLVQLGMKNAHFKVLFNNSYTLETIEEKYSVYGADELEFMFSANAGEPVKPLSKIISGGELSRFMLAYKCVLNENEPCKTLIFDEIDAGIGGSSGTVVAQKLAMLSKINQVLCVTHLAQISCYADVNFKVEKYEEQEKTFTKINELTTEEKIKEVARMLSGETNSISILHAKELVEAAEKFKASV